MRRFWFVTPLILAPIAAPIAAAQQAPAPIVTTTVTEDSSYSRRHPSWTDALEVGLYPTARHFTPDVHYNGLWGGGFTGTLGFHFAPLLALEAGYSDTWNPQIATRLQANPITQLATLSLVLSAPTSLPVVPYVSGGAGYNWFQFHLPSSQYPDLTDISTKGSWVWHPAAGFKFKLSYNTALRAEANMDVQHNQRASAGGFLGISFFPGARRPSLPIRTVTIVHPPMHDTVTVTVTRADTVRMVDTVQTQRTVVDTSVLLVLSDINFAFGKSTLRPQSSGALNREAQQLTAADLQAVPIQIIGYTDSIGSDSANYRLGLARANAVRDYLVAQGVPMDRITTSSGGKTHPVASNATAAGRAQNRRVVIRRNQGMSGPGTSGSPGSTAGVSSPPAGGQPD